ETSVARGAQRQSSARRGAPRNQRRTRHRDNTGIIPVLAQAVREVEGVVKRGRTRPSTRHKFQAIALLVREERARLKADTTLSESRRGEELKRLEGVATILAVTAARDSSLLALLADDAVVAPEARELRREMLTDAGIDVSDEPEPEPEPDDSPIVEERQVVPQAVIARQRSNPFLEPDYSAARKPSPKPRRLAGWELIEPLLRAFEYGGESACMTLPGRPGAHAAPGAGRRGRRRGAPHVPPGRRAGPGQDGAGAARRPGGRRLPAARRRAQRRQDELGPGGGAVDARAPGHRHPR